MADVNALLALIPDKPEFRELRFALQRVAESFSSELSEIDEARVQSWVDEIERGDKRSADDIRDDIFKYVVTPELIMENLGVDEATANALIKGKNDGGQNFSDLGVSSPTGNPNNPNNTDPDSITSILEGSDMQWYKDGDTWYVQYGLPNSDRSIFFEATPEQMDSLFGPGMRPDDYSNATFKNLSRRSGVVFGGSIAEVEGDGNFDREVEKTMQLALDEGKLPSWAEGSGEALDIIYIAQAEGKSTEWILEQMSSLPQFKERFSGIDKYMSDNNLELVDAVDDFLNYETALRGLEKQFGGNPDRIVPSQIGDLMNRGYTIDQVTEVYGRFDHMRKSADALNAFNAVLQANDMEALTLQGAYEFMLGNAPQELYDIWEAASITEMATAGGFAEYLDPEVALDYAYSTPGMLDAAQVNQYAQKAATDLLRMRHELDLGKYGLTHEDLVDAAFGMRPRSGATIAEVTENVQRATTEAQASLQGRPFSPFRDFNRPGQPAESLNTVPTR